MYFLVLIHYSFSQLFPKILFPLSLADIRGWHIFWARVEWSQTEAAVQHDEGVPGERRLRTCVAAVTMMTSSCCPLSGSTASGGRTPTSRTRSRSPSRPWPSPTTTCGCTGPRRSSTWWSRCRSPRGRSCLWKLVEGKLSFLFTMSYSRTTYNLPP